MKFFLACFFVFLLIQLSFQSKRYVIEAMHAKNEVIREALNSRKWIENKKSWSPIYSLKWGWSKDSLQDMNQRRIYNHFYNFVKKKKNYK